ncbi:MAG: NAD(P)-dependent oxidoreductase [Nitrososphaeria archaeon]|jgi:nucleoside-diphosphate-sugar epimerase
MPKGIRVLVTGASGRIGIPFREAYSNYYSLRLMSHKKTLEALPGEEVISADIADLNSVTEAMNGVEAVVHLAADSKSNAPWDFILNLNIIGTYNVFEAARKVGVKKVVYASSNHACGLSVKELDLVGPDAPIRPDSLYGVSKVFGEALGRYYSDNFNLSVICLRIGYCLGPGREDPSSYIKPLFLGKRLIYTKEKLFAMWISNRDMAQLIHKSLESDLKFGIFYGISDNVHKIFDISETIEKLGYRPQDRVEYYLK